MASDSQRPEPRPYTPSLWGDFFLNHSPRTPSQLLSMKEKADVMKEEVRQSIKEAAASKDLIRKLDLIDTLQRTGLEYHYKEEIAELLSHAHRDMELDSDDLYITSLGFYLLRKHGYSVSSDVFLKFIDEHGNVSTDDVTCLMTLYDAAHLRTHGEEILDKIITVTKRSLQSFLTETSLEPNLVEEVRITLETPRFRRLERVEGRRYISWYEKQDVRDAAVLEFAKLDFNISQALYCKELKELTLWWRDFQSKTDLRFARNRLVELHLWILGVVNEPYLSYSRITLTKFILIASLFDDLYDNYTTTEESNIFTDAMESWDEKSAERLTAPLKALYLNVLNTINKIVEELILQENKHSEVVKKLVISVAKSYHSEVKWRDEHYVPSNVEEHLQMSTRSSGCMHIANMAFILLGDVTTTEAVEWAFTFPKIITAICTIGRVANDITSHEREQASEHVASTVQTCMKQYGITVQEANEKLSVIIEEAWMDIMEECLDWKHPAVLLEKAVNLARTMDFMYKGEDAYTVSSILKNVITSMYVNSV